VLKHKAMPKVILLPKLGRKGLVLDSHHPEGWEKMKSMESRGTFRRLEVEEPPVGPPHFVTQLVVRYFK